MADQHITPTFIDYEDGLETPTQQAVITRPTGASRPVTAPMQPVRSAGRIRRFINTLDPFILIVVGALLAIGALMVYSTTFDWSYQSYGDELAIFMQHGRNMLISGVGMLFLMTVDYRIWKRFAVWLLLVCIALLIGVLIFGDDTFGARRALINGSLQPGEAAELVIVIYLAAWLSSRSTKVNSILYGFIPFCVVIGVVNYLVIQQPDLSTAAMISVTAVTMFFLAGADIRQMLIAAALIGMLLWAVIELKILPSYAQYRVDTFFSGLGDLTQANEHVQQAIIAFLNGGWTGVGLGQGAQKYGFLPAPHTDSIFAVIGEELGVLGAAFVVLLFVALAIRGFQIASRAVDPFGALLASGITIWLVSKAILNIAVMIALVPATGASLPFISFGGSPLVTVMAGAGLLMSVARVYNIEKRIPDRRKNKRSA